jgi:hypothetical protein
VRACVRACVLQCSLLPTVANAQPDRTGPTRTDRPGHSRAEHRRRLAHALRAELVLGVCDDAPAGQRSIDCASARARACMHSCAFALAQCVLARLRACDCAPATACVRVCACVRMGERVACMRVPVSAPVRACVRACVRALIAGRRCEPSRAAPSRAEPIAGAYR